MKTLLYDPIFINPLAYYVFPRLTKYLQADTESTAEPANYVGNIEVKVIAYGDTNFKRIYTNTNEIDLSEFKNTYVRISLFTKLGSCVLGEWKIGNIGTEEDIDPAVLESLVGVWIADQNTNDSPTRNIIKNELSDKGGDLEILNAAYKLNSGYSLYHVDFTDWKMGNNITTHNKVQTVKDGTVNIAMMSYSRMTVNIPSLKIKVSNIKEGYIQYYYREQDGIEHSFKIYNDGIYNTPISYKTETGTGSNMGFASYKANKGITIEQIPDHKGAFITDGVDDLIVSQKNISEMLNGSSEVTVISMIGSIKGYNNSETGYTNVIKSVGEVGVIRNEVKKANSNKLGIYGYSQNINSLSTNVNNTILGDKNDYSTAINKTNFNINSPFSVVGYIEPLSLLSQVAWYWTVIANKVLTQDQINQVIAYFNLDKYVEPIVYYDVKKQGLTNENHTQFNDKLIDYSGNGRDLQLYNFGWGTSSGIGKYETSFFRWSKDAQSDITVNATSFKVNGTLRRGWFLWSTSAISNLKVKVSGINPNGALRWFYYENGTAKTKLYYKDGTYILPTSEANSNGLGFQASDHTLDWTGLTIEQIPEYEGALVSDGVDDYGTVYELPIMKDYTVVADREIVGGLITNADGGVATRGTSFNNGAFCFDYKNSVYSFGNGFYKNVDIRKTISYQSKYINNGLTISVGDVIDTNPLCIARLGSTTNRYSKLALWSLLLFPYSLSEFLLERQLKKRKVGTLYPDMVEFRPVIKSNVPYNRIQIYDATNVASLSLIYDGTTVDKTGTYYPKGTAISIFIRPDLTSSNEVSSITINGKKYYSVSTNPSGFYIFNYILDKSPQNTDITIKPKTT